MAIDKLFDARADFEPAVEILRLNRSNQTLPGLLSFLRKASIITSEREWSNY